MLIFLKALFGPVAVKERATHVILDDTSSWDIMPKSAKSQFFCNMLQCQNYSCCLGRRTVIVKNVSSKDGSRWKYSFSVCLHRQSFTWFSQGSYKEFLAFPVTSVAVLTCRKRQLLTSLELIASVAISWLSGMCVQPGLSGRASAVAANAPSRRQSVIFSRVFLLTGLMLCTVLRQAVCIFIEILFLTPNPNFFFIILFSIIATLTI